MKSPVVAVPVTVACLVMTVLVGAWWAVGLIAAMLVALVGVNIYAHRVRKRLARRLRQLEAIESINRIWRYW